MKDGRSILIMVMTVTIIYLLGFLLIFDKALTQCVVAHDRLLSTPEASRCASCYK